MQSMEVHSHRGLKAAEGGGARRRAVSAHRAGARAVAAGLCAAGDGVAGPRIPGGLLPRRQVPGHAARVPRCAAGLSGNASDCCRGQLPGAADFLVAPQSSSLHCCSSTFVFSLPSCHWVEQARRLKWRTGKRTATRWCSGASGATPPSPPSASTVGNAPCTNCSNVDVHLCCLGHLGSCGVAQQAACAVARFQVPLQWRAPCIIIAGQHKRLVITSCPGVTDWFSAAGHYDVQPAMERDWKTDPFELHSIDGYFYARGASDNKASWVR